PAARLMHRLLILDRNNDGLVRADIGDRVGEDVRTLLLHQRGLLTGSLRLFIELARLLAVLDVGDDDALADDHLERVDCAAFGQWVYVDTLDPAVGRVVEDLGDTTTRGGAGHHDVGVRSDQRRLDGALAPAP